MLLERLNFVLAKVSYTITLTPLTPGIHVSLYHV